MKTECLDNFVVFGEQHLRRILSEFVAHFENDRPHWVLDQLPPVLLKPPEPVERLGPSEIVCYERLGRLLNHHERKVA